MKTLTAKDAKYRFGCLIDLARAEPVAVAKHGRPVVVVMAVLVVEGFVVHGKAQERIEPPLQIGQAFDTCPRTTGPSASSPFDRG
jgi:prevent-host-death family protein